MRILLQLDRLGVVGPREHHATHRRRQRFSIMRRYHAAMAQHPHDHEHDHHHDASELGEMDLRVRALQTVLAEKGLIDPAALDVLIDTYQNRIGPRNGARVVARAWVDARFDDWLRQDANAAIASLSLLPPENNASDMLLVRGVARNPNPPAPAAGGGPPAAPTGLNVRGLPLGKPPYGTITAIDMNKGEQLWRIAHGDTPDNVKNNPALKGLNIPRTGRPGRIGILTTKTLLIAGEGGFATTPDGRGAYLRAYDKATGADAGQIFMPAPQTGSPMTYMLNGTQYIAVAVSGPGYAGELLVYKLGQ